MAQRIESHRKGQGARLTEVAHERGIAFTVVRVWEGGDRFLERKLKNRHNGATLCPFCAESRGRKVTIDFIAQTVTVLAK